jgi:hypothetical protein
MTTTHITIDRRRAVISTFLAYTWSAACTARMTAMAILVAVPDLLSRHRRRCRADELGAISVEQFAWIGIALFLIVAAAAALKIYWGDVATFVTSSWGSITGQGGN